MLFVFGFALLVLAAAVVALFAMLAELASRVPGRPHRSTTIRQVDGARLGGAPDVWPTELPDRDRAVLLVLSTVCNSCEDVARQLVSDPGHSDWTEASVVISTGSRASGAEFVAEFGLERFPRFIDERGEWISGEFGIQSSPTALVFDAGRLESAYEFNDVAALRMAIDRTPHVAWEDSREKEEV